MRSNCDFKKFFAIDKLWYKRWWIWICIFLTAILSSSVPPVINYAYMEGLKLTDSNTVFTASDLLGFYGSILSFLGTVVLGIVAVWQNKKATRINAKLLSLDSKRETEKLFEMYFSFMEQCELIFDPKYILGDFKEQRSSRKNQAAKPARRRPRLLENQYEHHKQKIARRHGYRRAIHLQLDQAL